MPGKFHVATFDIHNIELRTAMAEWLTEQSQDGWEPIGVDVVRHRDVAQALVLLRHETD